MRIAAAKYRFAVIAAALLLAFWLIARLFGLPGSEFAFITLRKVFIALFLIVLGITVVWPTIAKRGFRADPFESKEDFPAEPLPGMHIPKGFRHAGLVVFAASLLSFVVFLYVAYTLNNAYLLWNMDGKRFEYLVRQQNTWFPFYFGYTNDFFHSLGNIAYPLNMKLDPGFFLATDPADGSLDRRLSYLIFSVELYLSTFLLGTLLRQGVIISAMAAWLVVLMGMPVNGLPAIYPVLAMAPNYPIAQTILILCLFRLVGRVNDASTVALVAAIILLFAHTALAHPTAVILIAPILAIFAGSILMASDNRREVIVKLIGVISGCVLLAILGFPAYLIGIFQYTAPYYFSSELFNDRAFYYFVSIAFQRNDSGFLLFLFAFAGTVLVARFGGRFERWFAIGALLAMALVIGAGAATVNYYQSWRGPSPIYFEFFLWPIYAVFAAATFRVLYHSCRTLCTPPVESTSGLQTTHQGRREFYVVAAILLCVPWLLLKLSNPEFAHTSSPIGFLGPIAKTKIVSALETEVGLRPGSLFRGRVATLTGLNIDRPVNWHDLNHLDIEILSRSGNSHQSIGLWSYDIPTLFELSSLITPPFFLVTREFLERPGDLQMRNAIVLRHFNSRILRALGVRFVVTDAEIGGDATLRIRQEMPTPSTHYLYELGGVNRGDYSPTKVTVIADVKGAMAALGDPSFEFTRTVILEKRPPTELVPAGSSEIHVEPGRLRLNATSEGTSILVLPFEFSNCLTLEPTNAGGAGGGRILRANLLQAGIEFTRHLDATLTYFTGPFRNSGCRMEDKRDMDRLNIQQFRRTIAMPASRFPGLQ